MTRCKVGDLAVIVEPHHPENLGMFVTVLEPIGFHNKDDRFEWKGRWLRVTVSGFFWWISAAAPLTSRTDEGDVLTHFEGHIADAALQPIRGIGPKEKEKEDIPHDESIC